MMNLGCDYLKVELDNSPDYQHLLFSKGFLISTVKTILTDDFPYYGNWNSFFISGYYFYIHKELNFYHVECDEQTLFLIGHAFDPFAKEIDENIILKKMAALQQSDFWKYEANLTGIYVMGKICKDRLLYHWTDCAGMRIAYYGVVHGNYYVSSHANLIAYQCNLSEDEYISELKTYKYFHYFGNVLPCDLSPYKELKRTVPNHCYCIDGSVNRFFPFESIRECKDESEYQKVVTESAEILRDTLKLCAQKWPEKSAAISVTGGKDSGVTLASANGVYDSFQYFSYISKQEESVDATAAAKICRELGITHRVIITPDKKINTKEFDLLNEIIYFNSGNVGYLKENEVRKRIVLIKDKQFSVEIKSWVDEITRAYWYKKYSKKRFPKRPTGKYLAALYKVFLGNRRIYRKTATCFDDYISKYMTDEDQKYVKDWLTLWSWEFGFSAGEGQFLIAEHLLSWDITIPFNNRHLIALMLKPKLEDRIADRLQTDIIKKNNYVQDSMNINVVNVAHTNRRAMLEKLYLDINSHIPF